jgi:hypothetical protein
MRNFTSLERRVTILERPTSGIGLDPLVLILERLNDNERGLLEEYFGLVKSGFSAEQIPEMMGQEAYKEVLRICYQVHQELDKLEQPVRPKRRGKKLRLPKEACYGDPGRIKDCRASSNIKL